MKWIGEFEQELDRRNIFVKKGSAAFNHFAFFKSKPRARRMSDDSMMIVFGSQVFNKNQFNNMFMFTYLGFIRTILSYTRSGWIRSD